MPSYHLVLSWATRTTLRVPGVSFSLGWEGPGPDSVVSPSYLRDPSVFPGSPVLFSLTLPYLQIAVGNMIYSLVTDGGDASHPCFPYRTPLLSAALSLGFRFCFPR